MKNLEGSGVVGGPVELHLIEKEVKDIAEENAENDERVKQRMEDEEA